MLNSKLFVVVQILVTFIQLSLIIHRNNNNKKSYKNFEKISDLGICQAQWKSKYLEDD